MVREIRGLVLGALAVCLSGFVDIAVAQSGFPSRPVRIIVPFGPGGGGDITARLVAEKLGEKLGQRFLVENQPGAGGIAAARAVLAAPADGHTLALLSNGTAISVPLFKNLPFDPLKEFVPISALGFFDFLFTVNAESNFRALGDVVKYALEKPGVLNVGTINVGSTQNLSAELFKSSAGISFAIIPYRTTPELLVALLRNDVQLAIDAYSAVKPSLLDNKLRVLASSGPARSEVTPDIPTALESGVRDFDVTSWNSLFAPAGTPPQVVDTLSRALRDVLVAPDLKRRLLELGIEARFTSPEAIQARLRADIEKWSRVIERAGIARQ